MRTKACFGLWQIITMLCVISVFSDTSAAGELTGGTYYIDALRGDDSFDGVSLDTAWKTVSHALDSIGDHDTLLLRDKKIIRDQEMSNAVKLHQGFHFS